MTSHPVKTAKNYNLNNCDDVAGKFSPRSCNLQPQSERRGSLGELVLIALLIKGNVVICDFNCLCQVLL